MKSWHGISFALVIIGGLDLGLTAIGQFLGSNWNILNLIFGPVPLLESLVYLIIGLAALYLSFTHKHDCTKCSVKSA